LLSEAELRFQIAAHVLTDPKQRHAVLDKLIDHILRLGYRDIVEDSDQFGHDPIAASEYEDCIHVIGIDIAARVTDTTIIPHLV
jgi:hypothetical protein